MELIDRQQALDIFDDYNVSVENGELEAYSRDRKRLCDLPPIQPEKAQLSRQGTTKDATSDTISRQAVIDAANDWYEGLICGSINGLIKRLNALPPAQPEPKEGHWIEGKIYRDVIECNCSECGQLMTTAASVRMNYCPHCGAKMKGERQK